MNDRQLQTLIRMALEAEGLERDGAAHGVEPVLARIGPSRTTRVLRGVGLVAGLAAAAGIAVVIWPAAPIATPSANNTGPIASVPANDKHETGTGAAALAAKSTSESDGAPLAGGAARGRAVENRVASTDFEKPLVSDVVSDAERPMAELAQVLVVVRSTAGPGGGVGCGCAKVPSVQWVQAGAGGKDLDGRVIYARADADPREPTLNVNDFACFHKSFASGDASANCDGSTTGPMLSVNDFVCFTNKFAHGCM